ncbi:hypothetical protein [uncultured Deinococcus sp.]|uniref:hypothetical protein n=1 Tax=uncultured Deinococcus sp. TaxID=158789 RepID=UPI00258C0652|nr:hypothetical protein [uncultured Deinococcus sp.]
MKFELPRPVLSILGLLIGFGLYALANRLAEPWQSLLIGALFALLGAGAWVYGRSGSERWIQALGALLFVYGLIRAFWLR